MDKCHFMYQKVLWNLKFWRKPYLNAYLSIIYLFISKAPILVFSPHSQLHFNCIHVLKQLSQPLNLITSAGQKVGLVPRNQSSERTDIARCPGGIVGEGCQSQQTMCFKYPKKGSKIKRIPSNQAKLCEARTVSSWGIPRTTHRKDKIAQFLYLQ